jgi:NAD-dependent deacetylase sirtuin 5
LPRCSKYEALARPGVVWFGEVPKHTKETGKLVDKADLCLILDGKKTHCRHVSTKLIDIPV